MLNETAVEIMSIDTVNSIRRRFVGTQIASLCDSHEYLVQIVEELTELVRVLKLGESDGKREDLPITRLQQPLSSSIPDNQTS